MRLLLGRGIDTKQSLDLVLQAAIASTNPEVRRVLRDSGVAPSTIGQVAPALNRVDRIDGPLIRELMDVGLDPNTKIPTVTVQVPLLATAAMSGDAEVVRALLDRGADPNVRASIRARLEEGHGGGPARDYRDVTPLGWADQYHAPIFVSRESVRLIEARGGRR